MTRTPRGIAVLLIAAFVLQLTVIAAPAAAAPGDLVADVIVPDEHPTNIAPSVAFDGTYLYYLGYGTPVLHRIDVPPAGGTTFATGHVATPITGAQGVIALAYDAGRDQFWAVGSDGLSVYLLSKTGVATRVFNVDPAQDRPGFQTGMYATEVKIAYDRSDDTIWYSPDATTRIYHYASTPDALGTAQLVAGTPYIDVGQPPNDTNAQCGYNQSSGVATGGANLFVSVAGCNYLFEYTKTGTKVAWHAYNGYAGGSPQDVECDDLTYLVPVFWIRDAWDGHIRAFEQPAGACAYGGGQAASPPPPPPPPPPSSGFPAVRSLTASSFPVHATSHAVAMPAEVSAGDLLLTIFTSHAFPTVSTPAGWTLVGTTLHTTVVRTSRYAKRANGSEAGTTVDFQTSQAETAVAHVYRITGWFDNGVLTEAVANAAAVGDGLAPDPPALAPSWGLGSTLWIATYGAQNLGRTSGYPAGYAGGKYDESGGLVGRTSTASARREGAVASEDPAPYTNDASQPWVGVTIAIRAQGEEPPPPPPPSGFPVVRSVNASSFAVDATSHAVAMPAQVAAGDLLVTIFTNHDFATVTTPAGWTLVGTTLHTTVVRTSRYAKRADGTEAATTVDFQTSQAETAVAHVYRITGWFDSGLLTDAVADAAAVGDGLAPDSPALAPSWGLGSTLWIATYGAQNLGRTTAYPAGYSGGRYDESGGLVGRTSTASARRDGAVASEDPGPFTNGASQPWVGVTIAIRPFTP
jgi:hypothetical protein